MDDLLATVARILGRALGRADFCGLDCPVSEFGWPEYALAGLAFGAAYLGTRFVMRKVRERGFWSS